MCVSIIALIDIDLCISWFGNGLHFGMLLELISDDSALYIDRSQVENRQVANPWLLYRLK